MERKRFVILLLVLSLYFPVLAFAETIYLKSGKTVEGEILEKTDKYIEIDFQGVPLTYYFDEIESIDDETDTKESIKNILAKSENIGSIKYEKISNTYSANDFTKSTATLTSKVWQKIPFAKIDIEFGPGGLTTLSKKIIVRPEGVYDYDSSKDKYTKISKAVPDLMQELLKGIRESNSLKSLGTETIDGKLATVVEYTFISREQSFTLKVWLWNEKGLPLKTESTAEIIGVNYITKIEYKNFNFEDIPDSVFEVPKDKIL